ncbi:MAG: SIS domain-containing protein, partial [Erysipelotrichaceae bacterium]
MTILERYYQEVSTRLQAIVEQDGAKIEEAATLLWESHQLGGRIYTFGTGQSHMLGQESYARAGGYAAITPICEVELTTLTHPF